MKKIHYLSLFILLSAISCSRKFVPGASNSISEYHHTYKTIKEEFTNPPVITLKSDSVQEQTLISPSPNFSARKPNYVIIHYTEQANCDTSLITLTDGKSNRPVSANYLICKDGTVYHLVNDLFRAWQAGVSKWGSITDVNSVSVGIEIDNNGNESFTHQQIQSLLAILSYLKNSYHIPTTNFIGHADVAPTRRADPGIYFPWKLLAKKGFGYWHDPDSTLATPPADFNDTVALRIIGYDISNYPAAVVAFKRHFVQTNIADTFSTEDNKILYNVYQKYFYH
jgi:N-acetylmuramoyl-L-alanine amidase